MSESEQEQEPAARSGAENIAEKAAGMRAAQPATPSDVEAATDVDARRRGSGAGAEAPENREAGDAADAGTNAPTAAQPGVKGDPDMKDMAVGPRPSDEAANE